MTSRSDLSLYARAVLLATAALSAELAWLHARSLEQICGSADPHCGWCAASVLSALAFVGLTMRRRLRPADALRRTT